MSKHLSGNVFVKDGFWYARFRLPDGTDSRLKLGPSAEDYWDTPRSPRDDSVLMSRGEAEKVLAKILAPWRDWTDDSDPTFRQAADEFILHCRQKGLSEITLLEYERIIRGELGELGPFRLSRLSEASIAMVQRKLAHRSCTNQVKTVLAGVVRIARKRRKYDGPDFSEWFDRVPVKKKLEMEVYTPAEIEKIANSCADSDAARIIRVAAYTGLRMSELRGLRWGDVDFAGEKITVSRRWTDTDFFQPPKNGKARTLPMAKQVADTLQTLLAQHEPVWNYEPSVCLVFGASGFAFTVSWFVSRYDAACQTAGIRRLRPHDLRHTAGTIFIQHFPMNEVMEFLGHADYKTTMRYLHAVPRQDAAARLSDGISSQLEGSDA